MLDILRAADKKADVCGEPNYNKVTYLCIIDQIIISTNLSVILLLLRIIYILSGFWHKSDNIFLLFDIIKLLLW